MGKEVNPITKLDKDTEDQVLGGINSVAEYVETNVRAVNERVDGVKEALDKQDSATLKAKESIEKKMEEGFEIIADKVARMEKRQIATGRVSLIDTTDCVLASMEPEEKAMIPFHQATMDPADIERGGMFADPITKAAMEWWFHWATKAQHKKWQPEWQHCMKRMAALDRGFNDVRGVETKANFVEDTDAMGGYLVPSPVAAEINKLIQDNTVVRPNARKIPMSSKTLDIPKKGTNFSAAIIGEGSVGGNTIGDSGPASNAFKMVQLVAKKWGGRATASIESIQDSSVGLLSYIRGEIAEELGILEDQQALEGDGTGSNFTGVVADADVNEYDGTDTFDYAVLNLTHLLNIMFKARHRASRIGCRWYMAPELVARTVNMTATDGTPIFQWNAIPNAPHGTILGFPVEPVSSLSITRSSGSSGTVLSHIYFGPPRAITFGDRQGLAWDVNEAPNWNDYLLDMRLIRRTAIAITNPTAMTRGINFHTTTNTEPT